MKYSVIIPIYNAEGTLCRCLDSLLPQLNEDIEVLLVNDGSTDSSSIICKRYVSEYSNFRYLAKENGGVSSARNAGLDIAKGDYILFVDSDDYVSEDYVSRIDAEQAMYNPDMMIFSVEYVGRDRRYKKGNCGYFKQKREIASAFYILSRQQKLNSLCTKAFRRNIIEKYHIRFHDELNIGEDEVFIFHFALYTETLSMIDCRLYCVDEDNTDSLSRRRRDYLTGQLIKVHEVMFHDLEHACTAPQIARVYYATTAWSFYRAAYSSCKELLKYDLSDTQRRRKIREICKEYSSKKVRPAGGKCWVIALPVILRTSFFIDILIKYAARKRKTDEKN